MATTGPNMPIQPWTCPHCKAVWHSGRQYCIDCGYGMTAVSGTAAANGQAASLPGLEEMRAMQELLAAAPQPPHVAAPPQRPDQDLRAQLERSLAAESALQAELAPLRERVGQLEGQLERQKTELVAGVQRLLEPLAQMCQGLGYEVSVSQCVTLAVQLLEQQHGRLAQLQHALAQRPAREPGGPPHAVEGLLQQIMRRLESLEGQREQDSTRVEISQSPLEIPAEGYGTWVVTDRRAHDLEQELLREQTQRGGLAYGDR